jgi:Sulfotransferase domain
MSRLSKAWRNSRLYRRRAAQRLPHFLIIGAQKGGTSALFQYLAQHPRLVASREKELEFFGSDLRRAHGLEWYTSHWDQPLPRRALRFEASPQYLFSPTAAARIRSYMPGVKLIAILRDPVIRAFSSWQMYRKQLADDPQFYHNYYHNRFSREEVAALVPRAPAELDDFQLAVEREADVLARGLRMRMGILEPGLYGPQLSRYLDVFPREQLLVLDNHDLRTLRVPTLNRVLEFLGLPPSQWESADLSDVFVGRWTESIPPRAGQFLSDYYRDSNRLLDQLLDNPPLFARVQQSRRASA